MRNSPLSKFLLAVLTVSVLTSLGLCWKYISNTREIRQLQTQAAMVQQNRAVVNALANEALEYSKKNPAIDPILEAANVKPSKNAPPATSPVKK